MISKLDTITAEDIALAIAYKFGFCGNIIIPNVHWGLDFHHEADLLIIREKSRLAVEVEIKISESDIKADAKKCDKHGRYIYKDGKWQRHKIEATGYDWHMEGPVKQLYFAVPTKLVNSAYIPKQAGIIEIYKSDQRERGSFTIGKGYLAKVIRPARIRKEAIPIGDKQWNHLLSLVVDRLWNIKRKIRMLKK